MEQDNNLIVTIYEVTFWQLSKMSETNRRVRQIHNYLKAGSDSKIRFEVTTKQTRFLSTEEQVPSIVEQYDKE